MHRTLITPSMVETFRACQRAYVMASSRLSKGGSRTGVLCKQFVLRAMAEINKGKLKSVQHVQKFIGQTWPLERLNDSTRSNATSAFLFAHKTLTRYVQSPYKPEGSQVMAVAMKVRARVPYVRVYLEDTFDLVLYYPKEKKLEIVDFHLQPLRATDPAWPSVSVLVKHFLAERLKSRWDFEKVVITHYRLGVTEYQPVSVNMEDSIFRIHWAEVLSTLEAMKDQSNKFANHTDQETCKHCQVLESSAIRPYQSENTNTDSDSYIRIA